MITSALPWIDYYSRWWRCAARRSWQRLPCKRRRDQQTADQRFTASVLGTGWASSESRRWFKLAVDTISVPAEWIKRRKRAKPPRTTRRVPLRLFPSSSWWKISLINWSCSATRASLLKNSIPSCCPSKAILLIESKFDSQNWLPVKKKPLQMIRTSGRNLKIKSSKLSLSNQRVIPFSD